MAAVMSSSSFDGLSGPSGPTSGSLEAEYRRVKDQLAQLEQAFADFQVSSRELESELEVELEEKDRVHEEMLNKIDEYRHEVNEWKQKYMESQREHAAAQQSNHKRIATLEDAHRTAMSQLRQLEMANDDMERHERIVQSSLSELEQKYHSALEEVAMLEAEVSGKDDLKVEIQRAKDELKESQEEVARLQRQLREAEKSANSAISSSTSSSSAASDLLASRRVYSQSSQSQLRGGPTAGSRLQPYTYMPASTGLSSSKSLRKIHGMLDQMKSLESRVATFKSSLPRSVTPTQRLLDTNGRPMTPSGRISGLGGVSAGGTLGSSNGGSGSSASIRRPVTPNQPTSGPGTHHRFTASPSSRSSHMSSASVSNTGTTASGPHRHLHRRSMTPSQLNRSRTPSFNMYGSDLARRGSESVSGTTPSRSKTPLGETSIPVLSQRSLSALTNVNQDAAAAAAAERRQRRRELAMATAAGSGSSLPQHTSSSSFSSIPTPSYEARQSSHHTPMRSVGSRSQLFGAEATDPSLRPGSASTFSQYQSRSSLGHGRVA